MSHIIYRGVPSWIKCFIWLQAISDVQLEKTKIRQCSFVFAFDVGTAWINITYLSDTKTSFRDLTLKKRYTNLSISISKKKKKKETKKEIEKKSRCSPLYANIIMDSFINVSMDAGLKIEKKLSFV